MSTATHAPTSPPAPPPFLLHSWSADFLAGNADAGTKWFEVGESAVTHAVLARIGIAVFLTLICARADPGPVLIIVPLTVFFIVRAVRKIRRKRRLLRNGQVLRGEVVRCTGRWAHPGGEDSDPYYRVTVEYRFQTPAGRALRRRHWGEREDLLNGPLPGAGTPVLVLYLDDRTYQLL